MLNSVNDYMKLPEDKEKEMEKIDTSSYTGNQSPSQLKETANEIKNCRASCE
jgi:hypothetical protein